MRFASAESFRQALEDRLKHRASEYGIDVNRLRKMIVFDRFLARLLRIYPEQWVLKGALSLELRYPGRFRTTRDADLGLWDDSEFPLRAIESLDPQDHFNFAVETTPALDTMANVNSVRYRQHHSSLVEGLKW